MKIVINTEDTALYNAFAVNAKEVGNQLINAKAENVLFDAIEKSEGDAYIISSGFAFAQKAIAFIKKSNPYIPIVFLKDPIKSMDIPKDADLAFGDQIFSTYEAFATVIMHNINVYKKNFEVLRKLTAKMHDKIEFANCTYDPTRRLLYHKGKEVKKLSAKEGGILEILAINYGEVVKKEVILEKVWRKPNDYFAGRSMDVYITYLRNTLKNNKIKLTIKNISGIGLILE